MVRHLVPLLLLAMLAAGCANSAPPPDPRLQQTTITAYRLDSGDKLRVTVFGQMDLTGEYNVDGAGLVALPLIQPIRARGQTADEFARSLQAELSKSLLRNPAVSVEVTLFRPFFILGEVNRPGQYPYVNGMTVQSAAAIAGGFTYRANQRAVRITRRTGETTLDGSAGLATPVMPGDTIMVNERFF